MVLFGSDRALSQIPTSETSTKMVPHNEENIIDKESKAPLKSTDTPSSILEIDHNEANCEATEVAQLLKSTISAAETANERELTVNGTPSSPCDAEFTGAMSDHSNSAFGE